MLHCRVGPYTRNRGAQLYTNLVMLPNSADCSQNLQNNPCTVFWTATVFILSVVSGRIQKLREQIDIPAVNFDTIEACAFCVGGGDSVIVSDGLDLSDSQCARFDRIHITTLGHYLLPWIYGRGRYGHIAVQEQRMSYRTPGGGGGEKNFLPPERRGRYVLPRAP